MDKRKNPIVMIIEDDAVDIEAVERGIKKRSLPYEIISKQNANDALTYLRSSELDNEQLENLIVFLDINMPGMNGHQFLDELRSDPCLKRTIVFVLTTSAHGRDRAMAYDKHVAGYFLKANFEGLLDTVSNYVKHVEFPPVPQD